ncbi:hypothetical protein EKE94_18400 [Mesobaculum littorinae]|uniref:Uncharacterized protein n=1 Tax=Mesobaculum littorinae TaxID=2486419 RepID=A0A438ACU6_9RHOB|nr:hypothetical protein [Mesobaculum littorinae]RVV96506.1 hypothetical protein EKE94_18400 [Mesobaculum littorinae]
MSRDACPIAYSTFTWDIGDRERFGDKIMSRVVRKIVGIVLIALTVFAIPLSFIAGNPAALGVGFGGLLFGVLLVGLAQIIALLEEISENTRHRGG